MKQSNLLKFLSQRVLTIEKDSPVLIGINGIDTSGKTTLTQALIPYIETSGRHIITASVDDFLNPEKIRYAQGEYSSEGCYHDTYNYKKMTEILLDPLKSGNRKYKTVSFDYRIDREVMMPTRKADKNTILIMEGIFLFRPELVSYWDLKIFLDIDFESALERAVKRTADQEHIGSEQAIIDKYNTRYIPAQQLYYQEATPKEKADIIIDNNDFNNPVII